MAYLSDAAQGFIDSFSKQPDDEKRTRSATVSFIDNEGTIWVRLIGSDSDTPVVQSSATVNPGDFVEVVTENGRARIYGNVSNPSAQIEFANEINNNALQALNDAQTASNAAVSAQRSADSAAGAAANAQESANDAATAAGQAIADAATANANANQAIADAAAASTAAGNAQTSANQAASAAATANANATQALTDAASASAAASQAQTDATAAGTAAANAASAAASAQADATQALTDAASASSAASAAQTSANQAASAASSAQTSANTANTAAAQAVEDAAAAQASASSASSAAYTAGVAAAVAQAAAEAAQGDIDEMENWFYHDTLGAHVLGDDNGYRTDVSSTGMQVVDTSDQQPVVSVGASGGQFGKSNGFHLVLLPTELSLRDPNDLRVAYIEVDSQGNSLFYVANAVIVDDLRFGGGDWKWAARQNRNLSLKWLGGSI